MVTQPRHIGSDIWIYEGSPVRFYGFPFPTRMTVVRLRSGGLWIHSPEKLNGTLINELSELGEVSYLVSPNKLHHLFLDEWMVEYPGALSYAAPGLVKKRADVEFDGELSDSSEDGWAGEIDQTIFRGSPVMEEVVFFHIPSRTLILTDLIENFDPRTLNWWEGKLARFAGIVAPNGRMPIDWPFSFTFGSKVRARESLATMLAWKPENIVLSHGECILGGGEKFLRSSFSWLGDVQVPVAKRRHPFC